MLKQLTVFGISALVIIFFTVLQVYVANCINIVRYMNFQGNDKTT